MALKNISRGFTLLEILIVIAIVGILSGILMVGFKDARMKARNAKRIADIRNYISIFSSWTASSYEFPDPGSTSWICLGDYKDNRCWRDGTSISENSAFNNLLADWSPLPTDETLICGYNNNENNCYEGYIYRCTVRTGGLCTSIDVRWFLEGKNQTCGPGQVIGNYNTATYCRYTSSI